MPSSTTSNTSTPTSRPNARKPFVPIVEHCATTSTLWSAQHTAARSRARGVRRPRPLPRSAGRPRAGGLVRGRAGARPRRRPVDPQITAHRSHSASCQVKRHLQAAPGLLSVLSLLYSAAVLRGRRPAGPARPGRFEHGAASHSGRPVRDHHTLVEPATSSVHNRRRHRPGVYESRRRPAGFLRSLLGDHPLREE
jgi:hypothetical protein